MASLRSLIPDLLAHIQIVQREHTVYDTKLLDLYNGSIQKYIEDSLKAELESKAATRAIERIIPINLVPKIINKASTVYNNNVVRVTESNDIDSDILVNYENDMLLDSKLAIANKYLTLFRNCALRPYINKGKTCLRVLPPTQFTVFSNNKIDPMSPTHYIEYMGETSAIMPLFDDDGVGLVTADQRVQDKIQLFHIYSDAEFLIVDSNGNVRVDLMNEAGLDDVNDYGRLPIIYLNSSGNELIPTPHSDMFSLAIQIPKMLSDLNYCVKFQSHSIVYGIDIDAEKLEGNPDSFWDLKSDEGEGKSPSLGTIKPEVDIEKVLTLIKAVIDMWLDSLGLEPSKSGNLDAKDMASGVSKIIDSADNTSLLNAQTKYFKQIENDLWDLIGGMHEYWVSNNELDMKNFSSDFKPVITFGNQEIFTDPVKELDIIIKKLEGKLTSYRRAIIQANPDLNDVEINNLIDEIKQEALDNVESANLMFNMESNDERDDNQGDSEGE